MLILILIDGQYSQNAVFSFEKGSNSQNHSFSGSLHPRKISDSHPPVTTIWKTLHHVIIPNFWYTWVKGYLQVFFFSFFFFFN